MKKLVVIVLSLLLVVIFIILLGNFIEYKKVKKMIQYIDEIDYASLSNYAIENNNLIIASLIKHLPENSFDTQYISDLCDRSEIEIPHSLKAVNESRGDYVYSRVRITDKAERQSFEDDITVSDYWRERLNEDIFVQLPLSLKMDLQDCDYYLSCDSVAGKCDIFAYDMDENLMIIISGLSII